MKKTISKQEKLEILENILKVIPREYEKIAQQNEKEDLETIEMFFNN